MSPSAFSLTEQDLVREISVDEQVFKHSQPYFMQAISAVQCIEAALNAIPETRPRRAVERILDLPCGHGRVLRALRACYPDAEIVASDILHDGVDFCAETFGAVPAYGEEDPRALELEGPFDLIWCGSLLTHLDVAQWGAFLDVFESLLADDGLLVLTTNGRRVADMLCTGVTDLGLEEDAWHELVRGYKATGFGYRDYPAYTGYGLSLSAPSWVVQQLERRPGLRLVTLAEMAWGSVQDVVSCVRRPVESVQMGPDSRELVRRRHRRA